MKSSLANFTQSGLAFKIAVIVKNTSLSFFAIFQKRYNETLTEASFRTYLALTSSSIIIGGFVGALCTRQLLIWVSRKRLLQATHFSFLPAVLLTAIGGKLTEAWEVFIIGRLLTGLPIGIFYSKLKDI